MFRETSFRLIPNSFFRKSLFILSSLLVCLVPQFIYGQNPDAPKIQEVTILELGAPVERELAGSEKHDYQITIAEDQYASITIERRGIDVAASLYGTDKKTIAKIDSIPTNGAQEKINFVAPIAGIYRLEIEARAQSSGAAGRYTVLLAELRQATEKERRLEEARRLYNESVRLYGAGEYSEALLLATRSLEIREKELGEEDADVAASLANLALIVTEKGDYKKAILLYQRALEIREKAFGTFHPDVARTVHNLANVYFKTGNFEEARRLDEKAVEIREKVSPDSADLAVSLNNLGLVYENLGDYSKAEQLMQRALEIKEKTLPPNSPSIASSLSTLAGVASAKGDEDKALELYRRALDIREKALGPNHPDVARSLDYLATSYRVKGDYKQAEANYLRALSILQKALGPEHYRVARTLGNLAVLYSLQGNYAKAEPLFQQTVTIMEKAVGQNHPDLATALNNFGEFYTDKGDYQKAEPLYKQALSIIEQNLGAQHPDAIFYLNNLARNYEAKGDAAQAINLWSRAHQISEHNAQSILLINSERQKLLYLNSLSGETNQYISAHLKFAPKDPAALKLALTTIFERKGRVSDAMALEFAALRNRSSKNDQALLDKLKEVTAQLAQKVLNGPENGVIDEHQKQIKELEEQKEKLEIEISRQSSEFYSQIQPVTISSIQSLVPKNAALVEFSIYRPFDPKAGSDDKAYGEPHYVVYVIHNQGEVKWKELGDVKQIDEAIDGFRQALRDPERKDVQQLARAVDEKVMQPVRALLGDATQLLVSPDGELNLIPFEALVNEQNRYLIENYSFTYLTSGRDLLRMQVARASKSKPLVIANPSFGEPPAEQIAKVSTKTKSNLRSNKRRSVTAARDLSGIYFAPLGGTAQEARSIQDIFPEATLLSGTQATKSALTQITAPSILHIATHGFFLQDTESNLGLNSQVAARGFNTSSEIGNPLLRSGLALAGANTRAVAGNDGILTALEASGLNLWGTKLVVLSACDTGLGEVKNGEGVYGLRRAFVLAGAESLVMSLWSVRDYTTRELMTNYYKNLKQGMGRSAALRQVQLEMLKQKAHQHPFYWAGFIQSGEWANLDGKR